MILRRYRNGQVPHSAGQASRRCSGQAATELAIFGAIIIFVLGAIIRSAVSSGQSQDASLKAMRNALVRSSKSNEFDTSRASASVLYVEDRLSPDFGKYGSTERAPFIAQGSGVMTNMLMYQAHPDELQDPKHVPVTDMFINGKHFVFTMGKLVYKRFSPSAGKTSVETDDVLAVCPPDDKCTFTILGQIPGHPAQSTGWAPACNGGRGCPMFYQVIVNAKDPPPLSDDASDDLQQEAREKRFCVSDPCPGKLSVQERFDLNRDGNFANDPPFGLYNEMAWQWRAVWANEANGDDDKALHIDEESAVYPSFDVDGDGQEETIYHFDYDGNGAVTGAVVFDNQEGDLDLGGDAAATGKVGLLNDMSIRTRTRPTGGFLTNYLSVQQGKAWRLDRTFVRSVNRKDQEDIVERRVQLSSDTGRMCGNPENPDVEACGSCLMANSGKTCFDRGTKILYVRSRIPDKGGHFWKTDASGQLNLGK